MDCAACKKPYTVNDHFHCMELLVDYPKNTVVVDSANKTPEVFRFLYNIIKSQVAHPERFSPVPSWFCKTPQSNTSLMESQSALDYELFRLALTAIDPLLDFQKFKTDQELLKWIGQDAYYLLRFMVLSCPLELVHTQKSGWHNFKVIWPDEQEQKFEQPGKKPEYLYHGSPLHNWQCILRKGIKVTSGTKWMSTGAAYGNGIYLSDTLHLSYHYSAGHGSIRGNIVIGVYEIYDAQKYLAQPKYFVVPTEDLLLLRYLIYVPANKNIVNLDTELRAFWDQKSNNKAAALVSKQKKTETRISKELTALEALGACVSRTGPHSATVVLEGIRYTVTFPYAFPFEPPVINDRISSGSSDWTPRSSLLDLLIADSTKRQVCG